MNRITNAYALIERRYSILTRDERARADAAAGAELQPVEIAAYNDARALAQASGRLSHDESASLYAVLGPNGWTSEATTPRRIVYLKTVAELMARTRQTVAVA